jgi:hypothetical protein
MKRFTIMIRVGKRRMWSNTIAFTAPLAPSALGV